MIKKFLILARWKQKNSKEENIIRIKSVIMVERETQKGIIIGHKGSALKKSRHPS